MAFPPWGSLSYHVAMRFPVLPLVKRDDYARPPPFVSVGAEVLNAPRDPRESISQEFSLRFARSMEGERSSDLAITVTLSWWPQGRHQDTSGVAVMDHLGVACEKVLGGPALQGLADALAGEMATAMGLQRKENLGRDFVKVPRVGSARQWAEGDVTRPCYSDTGRPAGTLWLHDGRGLVRDLGSPAVPGAEWMRPNLPEEFVRKATDSERLTHGLGLVEEAVPVPRGGGRLKEDLRALQALKSWRGLDPETEAPVLRSLRKRGLIVERKNPSRIVVTPKGRVYLKKGGTR